MAFEYVVSSSWQTQLLLKTPTVDCPFCALGGAGHIGTGGLRIGHMPAGLEAAHIQWHHVGGPDIETNGLSLCSLHHKLFDLGAFMIEPVERRVVFSQHAIGGHRGKDGALMYHGQPMLAPQDQALGPDCKFLDWNRANVFKAPGRRWN